MLNKIKKLIPRRLFSCYHYGLALLGAVIYRFPAKQLTVIGITGTKGKSSTTELINAILEENGHRTAVAGTIRFKTGDEDQPNLKKMTQPGRFFLQRLLRKAVNKGCDTAVLELTSEGAKQWRHKWLELDVLVFTNLSPEHIESHGSYEKYREAKLSIGRELEKAAKQNKYLAVNADDPEHHRFIEAAPSAQVIKFSQQEAEVTSFTPEQQIFRWRQKEWKTPLTGDFNRQNILAALCATLDTGLADAESASSAISKLDTLPGRTEKINRGQDFSVVVDYAHTPDSLEKLYQAFAQSKKDDQNKTSKTLQQDRSKPFGGAQDKHADEHQLICVLGNTGGGRDKWKRPVMGEIADRYCDEVILTNEDPYDEDPEQIVEEMRLAIKNTPCRIIIDRREAIHQALRSAASGERSQNSVVLISGKGTDPYIMGSRGERIPWSDRQVAEEELNKLVNSSR